MKIKIGTRSACDHPLRDLLACDSLQAGANLVLALPSSFRSVRWYPSRGFRTRCLRFRSGVDSIPARLASGWLAKLRLSGNGAKDLAACLESDAEAQLPGGRADAEVQSKPDDEGLFKTRAALADRLLTAREAANFLKMSASWLAKSRMRGDGPPYVKIGRAIRYSESALLRWMRLQVRVSTGER
jgi:predicted DNA-binding transcriptional regulator AlpA